VWRDDDGDDDDDDDDDDGDDDDDDDDVEYDNGVDKVDARASEVQRHARLKRQARQKWQVMRARQA
jgi:hypothetical protein